MERVFLVLSAVLIFSGFASSQEKGEIVFPKFPGGDSAIFKYVENTINYPAIALENGIEGSIVCEFSIAESGELTNLVITHGEDNFLIKEVASVLFQTPKFQPGTLNGIPRVFKYSATVSFWMVKDTPTHKTNINEHHAELTQFGPVTNIPEDFYSIVETMPKYPGGDAALLKFIAETVEYPVEAYQKKLNGVVYISYIVDVDGSIKDVQIAKGSHKTLNEEAVRVVKLLKGYKPGIQDGKPVPVQFTVPIRFVLYGRPSDTYSYSSRQFTSNSHIRDYSPMLEEANKALGKHEFDEAVKLYTRSIELKETETQAYFERGVAYYALEEIDKAEADFAQAIKLSRFTHVAAHMTRGEMRMENGMLDSAIVDFLKVLESNNNVYEVNLKLGQCWLEKNELRTARKYFRLANSARPNNEDGHYYLGILEITRGEYDKAIESFNTLLEVNPNHGGGYFNRGMAKARLRDLDAACIDWKKAKELGIQDAILLVESQCSGK